MDDLYFLFIFLIMFLVVFLIVIISFAISVIRLNKKINEIKKQGYIPDSPYWKDEMYYCKDSQRYRTRHAIDVEKIICETNENEKKKI